MMSRTVNDVYRDLFRNLYRIGALRRNPLVCRLFARSTSGAGRPSAADSRAAEQVRSLVTHAVEALESASGSAPQREAALRAATIVRRCDLERLPHKRVAAELGLSMRQFYRERDRAIGAVGERFEEVAGRVPPARVAVLDAFEIGLQRAHALRYAGLFSLSLDALEQLERGGDASGRHIVARCSRIEVLAETNRFDEAERLLAPTLQDVRDFEGQRERSAALEAVADFTAAVVDEKRGALASSQAHVDRALERLRRPEARFERLARTTHAAALALACDIAIGGGRLEDARRSLDEAQGVLDGLRDAPGALVLECVIQRCNLHSLDRNGSALVVDAYDRAQRLARQFGLASGAVNAALIYATHLTLTGRAEEGTAHARSALECAAALSGHQNALAHLIACECAIAARRYPEALAHVAAARTLLTPSGRDWARAQMLEAQIHCLQGNYEAAIGCGTHAVEASTNAESLRFAGASLRILAEAYAGARRRSEAKSAIRSAVEILQTRGHRHSLGTAYRVSARILGDAAHERIARELLNPPRAR